MKNFKNLKEESIKKIKEYQQAAENPPFSFKAISGEEVKNAIKDFTINKSTISADIPTKILKQHAQISSIVIEVIRTVLFFYEKILTI